MSDKTVIEVNGVKMEVDLRHAKRVDEIRVGDRVKVLVTSYGNTHHVYPGTVIGFEPFNKLPTIIVAYVESSFSSIELKFVHFNADSKDVEIIKAVDDDHLDMNKADILKYFDRQMETHRRALQDLEAKREYFLDHFQSYWTPLEVQEAEEPF